MRARVLLLVVAILLVGGFAALNWSEFVRTTTLNFGLTMQDAPLGLLLLGVLALTVLAFLLAGAMQRTRSLVESRNHAKALERQRELADKAETSRFTELRTHFDSQLRELRQRDAISATELEKAAVQNQRELKTQLDQMNRMMSARLSELEARLDARLGGLDLGAVPGTTRRPAPLHPDVTRSEHATAESLHEAPTTEEYRREERLREDDRVRAEAERARDRL